MSSLRATGIGIAATCLMAWACSSLPDQSPTQPDPSPQAGGPGPSPTADPNPNPTPTPVLSGAPKPAPSPDGVPSPGSSPSPGPSPSNPPPTAGACGSPIPPPLSSMRVKVHSSGGEAWILDSTPLVDDPAYCVSIGYDDGRSVCPVRPEGNPEREACETYVMGNAKDTGRPGPTWTFNGAFCSGKEMGCSNSPENQYQVRVFVSGVFRACGNINGACGEVRVDR